MILYSYNISPYAAKVRAILRYLELACEERVVHPMRQGEVQRVSGQRGVPVLVDGATVISDSSLISRYLDGKATRKILPADAALRARALLLEEWADEGLPRVVQPVRWLEPANFARSSQRFRSAYPRGAVEDLRWVAIGAVMKRRMRARYGDRTGGHGGQVRERLAETLDAIDGVLAETGWLAGPSPSVADFAAYGLLGFLEGLDGWELVTARPRVLAWIRALG